MQASIDIADLTITNLADSSTVVATGTTYAPGNVAGWSLPANIPAGNYQAVLTAAGVKDAANNSLASGVTLQFFILPGDINRDRSVDTLDFNILAQSFGTNGALFSQGDVDLNGSVDSSDFVALIAAYGNHLPASSSPSIQSPGLFASGGALAGEDSVLPQ